MLISDWSSDVCSSDLCRLDPTQQQGDIPMQPYLSRRCRTVMRAALAPLCTLVALAGPVAQAAEPAQQYPSRPDRQSVVSGKRVSVRVDLGSRRIIKKKTNN